MLVKTFFVAAILLAAATTIRGQSDNSTGNNNTASAGKYVRRTVYKNTNCSSANTGDVLTYTVGSCGYALFYMLDAKFDYGYYKYVGCDVGGQVNEHFWNRDVGGCVGAPWFTRQYSDAACTSLHGNAETQRYQCFATRPASAGKLVHALALASLIACAVLL
jgi:hypothetical protein